jgi:hypothetical protein
MDEIEWGEDPETGLLPNYQYLRGMNRAVLLHLAGLVADWEGPIVDAWRTHVADLLDETGF